MPADAEDQAQLYTEPFEPARHERGEFYRRMGFESFSDHPQRMFMTIGTIRSMFPEV